jgi:uncharacterized protein (TIGR03437 family)
MRFALVLSIWPILFAQPLRVEGNRLVDQAGRTIVLRGAEIPGLEQTDPARHALAVETLSATTFGAMRLRWNMNVVRIPVSARTADLPAVAEIVRKANVAGLVVILAAEDAVPDFWKRWAAYFKDNPMMIFDVAAPDEVEAIRSTGAGQVIAVPPRAALDDPNLIYEVHPDYSKELTDAQRDAHFGFLAQKHPLLAAGWGFLPGEDSDNCRAVPDDPNEAWEVVQTTLWYFEARGISWTVGSFLPGNLFIDFSDYYRTDLPSGDYIPGVSDAEWICGRGNPNFLGIGQTVNYYLNGIDEGDLVPVSGGSGNVKVVARGSVVPMYGMNMADREAVAPAGPPPLRLGGISVRIADAAGVVRQAPLRYVSPFLVNLVIPSQTALGTATFTILRDHGERLTGTALVRQVAPGLFTRATNGYGPAVGTAFDPRGRKMPISECDGAACKTVPIEGVSLRLVCTGIRNGNSVTATIGGIPVEVVRAGSQNGPLGIDEVELRLSAKLRGLGETDLIVSVDGRVSNPVRINLR